MPEADPIAAMSPATLELLKSLAIAGGLGLLIGLERERSEAREAAETGAPGEVSAGIRTIPMVAVWGVLAAWLSDAYSNGVLLVSVAGLLVLLVASYWWQFKRSKAEPGMTTPVVLVVTFFLGVLVHTGEHFVAIIAAVAMTALLAFKVQIHRVARGLTEEQVGSILEFVVLMAVVLPLLPNHAVDPLGALNPREIGLMVTLIAGISLAGFVLVQFAGASKGLRFTAALGGLVSSTAVTLSFSKHSKTQTRAAPELGLGMALACMIMFPRILLEVAAVGADLLPYAAVPIGAMLATAFLTYRVLDKKTTSADRTPAEFELQNPTELSTAIKFGLIYALIRWGSSAASEYAGSSGLYLVALAAGATDVDAITLSMARMAGNEISNGTATMAITLAAISNNVVKLSMAWVIAHPSARKPLAIILSISAVAGAVAVTALKLLVE